MRLGSENVGLPCMSGKECYRLRCALLHEGTEEIASETKITDFTLTFNQSSVLEESSTCECIDNDEINLTHKLLEK